MSDFMSIRIETIKNGKLIAMFTGCFDTLKDMEIDFMSIMENCQVTISWELCPYKALDPTIFIVFNAKEETFAIETMINTKSGIISAVMCVPIVALPCLVKSAAKSFECGKRIPTS
jgi:hypothetical protein